MNNQPYTNPAPQQNYAQPNPAPQPAAPAYAIYLKTNRSLLKFILLGMITFGIYPIVVMCVLSGNINTVAQRYDGKSTMNWFLAMILGGITLGIVPIVWYHRVSNRIQPYRQQPRRKRHFVSRQRRHFLGLGRTRFSYLRRSVRLYA